MPDDSMGLPASLNIQISIGEIDQFSNVVDRGGFGAKNIGYGRANSEQRPDGLNGGAKVRSSN